MTALAQQILGSVNQRGPNGSVTYSQDGTTSITDPMTGQVYNLPRLTQTTSLSPQQQQIFDATQLSQANLARQGVNLSASPLPAMTTALNPESYAAGRQRVENALFDRLNGQLERDRSSLEASLAGRGIRLGSTAYDRAQEDFGRNVNDARTSAILSAGQEQSRLQGMDLNAANFANGARTQALNERLTLAGLQPQMPQAGPAPMPGLAGTDVAGITANANNMNMNSYLSQLNQWNGLWGGLFGLGANALMAFSDRRLKTEIEDTGARVAGVPVKTWAWKGTGERDAGVIAQDVEKKHPELVDRTHPSGFRRVDYGGLMRLGETALREAA